MNIETSISMPNKLYRKTAFDIEVHVNIDLSEYKIHAELFDRFYSLLKLNTEDNGGSDDEIEIINDDKGNFTIHIPKDKTELFHLDSYLEIDLIDEDENPHTCYFGRIKFEDTIYMRVW